MMPLADKQQTQEAREPADMNRAVSVPQSAAMLNSLSQMLW